MGGGGGGGRYFWTATIVRLFGFDAGKERKRNALLGFFSSSSPSSSSFSTGFLVGDTSAGVATPVAASSAPDLFGFPFLIFFTFFFGRLNRVLNGRFLLVSFLFVGGFTGFFTPVASVLGLIPRLSIKEAMAYRVSRALPLEKPSHLLLPSPGRGPCPPPTACE